MSEITLKKDGFYLCDRGKVSSSHELMTGWHSLLSVEEGVTLFSLIDCLEEIEAIDIIESLINCNIKSFFKEIYVSAEDEISNIEKIQVTKCFDLSDGEMFDATVCSGILKEPVVEEGTGVEIHTQGLEFTPWNKIKDLPLEISKEGSLYRYGYNEDPKESFNVVIRLGEFLYGLFDELSFFGDPEHRDSQFNSLKKTIDEVKSGSCKTVLWEDIDKELKHIKEKIRKGK